MIGNLRHLTRHNPDTPAENHSIQLLDTLQVSGILNP